jgi:hypothetical protein
MAGLVRLPSALTVRHSYLAPTATHWRRATCEEVDCPAWREGFVVDLDERADPGMGQARFLRAHRGRWQSTEEPLPEGLTRFRFPAGQPCLHAAAHKVRADRPGLFVVARGDARPTQLTAEQWRDDLGETLEHHAIRQSRR